MKTQFRVELGVVLKQIREERRYKLRTLGALANVTYGYISEIENGKKEPSSEMVAVLAEALGMKVSEILRRVADRVEFYEKIESVGDTIPSWVEASVRPYIPLKRVPTNGYK